MELPWTSFLPLVYSTSLVLTELYLRVLDRRRRSSPYLSYKLYLLANFMLWLSCVALVAVALYRQAESVSIASFQVVWMQGSILGVGVITLLYQRSRPLKSPGLSSPNPSFRINDRIQTMAFGAWLRCPSPSYWGCFVCTECSVQSINQLVAI